MGDMACIGVCEPVHVGALVALQACVSCFVMAVLGCNGVFATSTDLTS